MKYNDLNELLARVLYYTKVVEIVHTGTYTVFTQSFMTLCPFSVGY